VRKERAVVATLFALALAVAFPHVLFFGASLLPSDNLNPFDYRLIPQNYGPAMLEPAEYVERGLLTYPNFHDIGAAIWQSEPGLIYLRDALRDGELPLWDPYTGSGSPALANLTCAFLFPPQLIIALLGATSFVKNMYLLLIFWTAGFATYVVLRQHAMSPLAAFAGGIAFMFSGAVQQAGPVLFKGQALVMIPVVLALTRWFIDRPTWQRVAILSVIFALIAQASFPPMLLAAFGTATLYVCVTVWKRSDRAMIAKRFAAAAGLSLGMSMFLFVPAAVALAHSSHAQRFYAKAASITLRWRAFIELLSPTATGGKFIYVNPVMDDYDQLFYMGAIALMVGTIGALRGRRSAGALWTTCAIAGGLTFMKLFGVPPVQWIEYVPGFRTVHFHLYFGVLLDFVIALFVAMGLDALMRHEAGDHALAAPIAIVVMCFVGMHGISYEDQIWTNPDTWRWVADWQMVAVFALAGALLTIAMDKVRSARVARALGYLTLLAIFIEGLVNTTFPRQRRFDVFANLPPYVITMQHLPDSGRYFTWKVLDANLGSSASVRQVDSIYNFHESRIFQLYSTYTQPETGRVFHFLRDATVLPPDAVLDRMNVAYVAVRAKVDMSRDIEDEAIARGYEPVFEDSYAHIYERSTMPRTFFSSAYQVASRDDGLKLVGTAERDRIILEERPPFVSTPNAASDAPAQIVRSARNHIAVKVRASRAGLVYLADSWFPGWTARVNGRRTPILAANYAYRAVPVAAGESLVEFDYWPTGLTAGLIVSAIALVATIITWRRRTILP